MFSWELLEPFQQRMARARADDDPQFAAAVQRIAATPPEAVALREMRDLECRVLADEHSSSFAQQARFWYLIGRAYASQQRSSQALEALRLSIRAFDKVRPPDLVVGAHLRYAFAVLAQEKKRFLPGLSACNEAIDTLQQLLKQPNAPGEAQRWQTALAEAHRLHQDLLAAMIDEEGGTEPE